MPLDLTKNQQNALKWHFEKEAADWILTIQKCNKTNPEGTISSDYGSYIEKVMIDKRLDTIEKEYNAANDKQMASTIIALAGKEYTPPKCLVRTV